MTPNAGIDEVTNVIQIAVAPVFMLTATVPILAELSVLRSRMQLIYLAVALDVICALFVGMTIVITFAEALTGMGLAWLTALLFVAAMVAFIASLAVFLREIFLAVRHACGMAGP